MFAGRGADVRVPPVLDPRSGRVRQDWLVSEVDPASAGAIALALRVKLLVGAGEVTVVHLGEGSADPWLRSLLARGVDRVVRVWDEEVAGARAAGKALIAAAAAEVLGFDLVLAGTKGVVNGAGQFGRRLAFHLSLPCVTQAVSVFPGEGIGHLEIERALEGGFRERVAAKLPLALTVTPEAGESDETGSGPVPARKLLAAAGAPLPVWTLADLGVPRARIQEADGGLEYREPRPVRPRFWPLAAPDPALPAFERILKLLEGRVARREGRVVGGSPGEIAEEIFRVLLAEGWLDHLRDSSTRERGSALKKANSPREEVP